MVSKKPLTHCEKYGHTWSKGTSEGWDVCSHVSYDTNGKPVFCRAARRIGVPVASVPPTNTTSQPVVHAVSLWS